MSDNIKLSPEHGINPSIKLCFWCGQPDGIILMGQLPNDIEAPRECVVDYEPCESCKEKFEDGVLVVEVSTEHQPNQPIMSTDEEAGNLYPTGRWVLADKNIVQEYTPVIMVTKEIMDAMMAK